MALLDSESSSRGWYRDGLRGWLDQVQQMGELLHVSNAHWDAEMGSITQMLTEKSNNSAPAILFDDIPGYPKGFRTLYGHFSTVKRVALTLGLPLDYQRKVDIVQRYHARMQNMKTLPPRFVKDGPILQNVLEGDAIDVLKFPVPRHHEQESRATSAPAAASSRRIRTTAGTISAPTARRSTTATRSAARSPRASTAASTATSISSAASR
jgi:hypothetical protein